MISIEQATQTRIALVKAGFCPLPFACKEKRPVIRNWQRLAGSIDEACIIGWQEKYPNATGTGVLAGHLTVVDVDVTKPELVEPIKAAIQKSPVAPLLKGLVARPRLLSFFSLKTQ